MREPVTAHCVIRNEDVWIWYVIQAALPAFDKIIITDTGSEDNTLKILDTIKSDKIELIHRPKLMGLDFQKEFTEYRNEQIRMTKTPWWFLLDGDEIFTTSGLIEMMDKLSDIPKQWTTLSTRMKYFVDHMHRVATKDAVESYKFVRTGTHKWGHGYGQIILADPAPAKNQRLAHWYKKDGWDFECCHVTFLQRSTLCDGEEFTYQRQHRKTRTQHGEHYRGKFGFSGPYPEVFYRTDVPEIVKNPYIEQIHKSKEEFGM